MVLNSIFPGHSKFEFWNSGFSFHVNAILSVCVLYINASHSIVFYVNASDSVCVFYVNATDP
jgi:hypothetical protein